MDGLAIMGESQVVTRPNRVLDRIGVLCDVDVPDREGAVMADVVLKADVSVYKLSANTVDHPAATWLHNPPGLLSLLPTIPPKYWKLNGTSDDIEEMTVGEKTAVDDAEAAAQLAADRAEAVSRKDIDISTRELVNVLLQEINKGFTRIHELQDALTAIKNTSGGSDNIRAAIPTPRSQPPSAAAPAAFTNLQEKLRSTVLQEYADNINAGNSDPV